MEDRAGGAEEYRDEEQGGVYVYSDENQRIFARFGRPPVALVPLVLDHNLRNTKQIHESFGPLAPSRMYSRGGDGPSVRFVGTTQEERVNYYMTLPADSLPATNRDSRAAIETIMNTCISRLSMFLVRTRPP